MVKHTINIGDFSTFIRDQHEDFWGKLFVKGGYTGDFWGCVAHKYGGAAFSLHIKSKLQEQDNVNTV